MTQAGSDRSRAERAAARAGRVTVTVIDGFSAEQEPDAPTPEARLELQYELTRAAWAMSGRPWPSLPRAEWPVRRRRLGDDA